MKRFRLFSFQVVLVFAAAWLQGCHQPAANGTNTTPVATVSKPSNPSGREVKGIRFEEVARKNGLDFAWPVQSKPMRNLEAFGVGCAFLDYDNDGWQDILFVSKPTAALFRNKGNGTFENATQKTGLHLVKGDWKAVAVGDYNDDGFLDVMLSGFRCLALLQNQSGQKWKNATQQAGFDRSNRNHWGSSGGFMDLDNNGTLDFVLCNYVIFGPKEPQFCELLPGVKSGCPPSKYRPEFAELWRNDGKGHFTDVTKQSGFDQTNGKALVVAFSDINDDGRMDFYMGNDGVPAELMINQGQLKFRNEGVQSGTAYGVMAGRSIAAMGADWADYDGDDREDLAISAFSDESYSLLRNAGKGLFEHKAEATGIAGATLKPLGFGTKWADVDNDGWPDLIFANGHVYDRADDLDPLSTWRQPLMLFHNVPAVKGSARRLLDIAPQLGGGMAQPIVGRGLATGDFDNDGKMDLLAVDYEGHPLLLHNQSSDRTHWLTLDVRGKKSNRFAYGAHVTIKTGKRIWSAHVSPASSYLSSSDPRLHFGLGNATQVYSLTIRWLTGERKELKNIKADQILKVSL